TPRNKVFAINAETGEQRWMFDPGFEGNRIWNRCRGVAYYESTGGGASPASAPGAVTQAAGVTANEAATVTPESGAQTEGSSLPTPAPTGATTAATEALCATRIITTTAEAELYSLDARTGELCPTFGDQGRVDLTVGMGE